MPNIYRANVVSIEPAANGTINADVFIELRGGTSPDFTWTPTSNGHFTVVIQATDILTIINDVSLSPVQKRQAIRNLVRAQALARGVDVSDEAYAAWITLIPNYPDSIIIRQ